MEGGEIHKAQTAVPGVRQNLTLPFSLLLSYSKMKFALLFNCLLIWATLFTGPTNGFRLMEKIKSGLSNGIDNSVNALKLSLGLINKPPVAAPVEEPEEFLIDAMVPEVGFEEEEEEEMGVDLPHGIHGHRIGMPAPPHTYQHHHLPQAAVEEEERWDAPPRHVPHGGHHHHQHHNHHHPKLPPTPEEEPAGWEPQQLRPHGLHHGGVGGHHGGGHHHGGLPRQPMPGRGVW